MKRLVPLLLTFLLATAGSVLAQERIISLNGDITEYIFALGADDQLVAVDATSDWPEAANDVPNIGYAGRLSAEALLSHAPTVIIANELASPPEALEQVRASGVDVVFVTNETSLDVPFENLEVIARITGTEERAGELAAQLRAELASAAEAAEALEYTPRVLFLYLGSTQMQFAGGVDVPSNLMITAAGGIDAGAEAGFQGYQPFTPEALVAAAPDVLLVTRRGVDTMGGTDAVFDIPGIMQTPAGLARNIIVFDDNYLLSFGLRTGAALQDLTAEFAKLR